MKWLRIKKYEVYLVSLLILVFGELAVPTLGEGWQHIIVIQNVVFGLLLFSDSKLWLNVVVVLISIILITECLFLFWAPKLEIRAMMGLFFIIYFLIASVKLYSDILMVKEVKAEMISAVFSGFIMLSIIGGFIFTLIELNHENSFTNLGEGEGRFRNLNYLSFVSTLTIGYGDIIPITFIAKKATIFVGLTGNFYMTFITALIVGKFINQKNK